MVDLQITSYVAGKIADTGIEIAKTHFNKHVDKKQLKETIENYVNEQRKFFEVCDLHSEFDFQGLIDYLQDSMIDDLRTRCFSPNPKERGRARQEIESKAIYYASADTVVTKKSVSKFVHDISDMLYAFYKSKIGMNEWLVAIEIIDSVEGIVKDEKESLENAINEKHLDTLNAIETSTEDVISAIGDISNRISDTSSVSGMGQLAKQNNIAEIQKNLKKLTDTMSYEHILYPDYGYKISGTTLVSVPLTPEAELKYPPRYVCRGFGHMDGKKITNIDHSTFEYANRHQQRIFLTPTEVKKYLGDYEAPDQDDAKAFEGAVFVYEPKPFPPAFPCSISIDGKVYYDYVELRTREILEDGTYIIDNSEQSTNMRISIQMKPHNDTEPLKYTMSIKNASHSELLQYNRMMQAASKGGLIHIKLLQLGKDFLKGKLNEFDCPTGFATFEEEIDFLERVCDIEQYFNVDLSIPEQILEKDASLVSYISELIRGETTERPWSAFSLSSRIDDGLREYLSQEGIARGAFCVEGNNSIDLFGQNIDLRIRSEYLDGQMVGFEKLLRKMDVLDNGDPIEIHYEAIGQRVIKDTLVMIDNGDGEFS